MDDLIMGTFLAAAAALPLLYLVVQLRALLRWTGTARALAALPALGALLWLVVFLVQVSIDPSSHNLLPFELILGAMLGLGCLGLIALGRRVMARFEAR